MIGKKTIFAVATVVLAAGLPGQGEALPFAPPSQAHVEQLDNVISVRAGGGEKGGRTVKRTTVKRNNGNVTRKTTVKRSGNVNRNVTVKRNVYVNRNVRRTVVVKRPYRAWGWRPYYGTVVGGVALGTVIGVGAAYAVPAAPGPNMCWYWADAAGWRGYWDYCVAP